MKRLPKGYGSVHKLSGSRRKPYAARICVGTNAKGNPDYKYLGYFATQQEALNALTEYNKNPYDTDLSKNTIADMYEIFKERKFGSISESGKYIYSAAYKHLAPIHDKRIADLKTYQLQSLIDSVDRKWQTKSHIQTLLNQMYDIAVELDIIQKNYASFIKLDSKPVSDIHSSFTADEIRTLFNSVFSEQWADTVLILIYTGMRPSELLGIKITDVNLSEKYMVGGLKTKAGKNRLIPINDKVMPFVRKRYNPNAEYLIEEDRLPLSYNLYKKYFYELMKRLDMNHKPHDGRHTFASLANTAGVNAVSVKLIMGHASSDITERVYTHKAIDELITAVNMI